MITDEVDDTTMVEEKTGFFKKLMNKKNKKDDEDTKYITNDERTSENTDSDEYDNEKTVKIVGFNQADDDVLEILEGTQTMEPVDDGLKELNELMKKGSTEKESVPETTNNYDRSIFDTNKIDLQDSSNLEQLNFNLQDTESGYKYPSIDCLKNYNGGKNAYKEEDKSGAVINTLKNFNIEIENCNATFGPTITRY